MIMKRVIFLLSFFFALFAQAQQPTTMITTLSNGAAIRTDVSEVEKITFADTTYNLNNNGYRILESDELCWPEDRLLPVFLPPQPCRPRGPRYDPPLRPCAYGGR